jgi:hypothetical protein
MEHNEHWRQPTPNQEVSRHRFCTGFRRPS